MNADDIRGRSIAQFFWDEIEKIAEQGESEQNAIIKEEEIDEVKEVKRVKDPRVTSPGEMFGVQFSKMRDGSAKMKPMIMPVPGYTFKPTMQKFVPDLKQPGWITSGEEMMARAKREGYIQAKKEEAMSRLQQEAERFMQDPQPQQAEGMAQPGEAQPQAQEAQQQSPPPMQQTQQPSPQAPAQPTPGQTPQVQAPTMGKTPQPQL